MIICSGRYFSRYPQSIQNDFSFIITSRLRTSLAVPQSPQLSPTIRILLECKAILILFGGGIEKFIQMGNQQVPRIFCRAFVVVALASWVLSASDYAKQNMHREISVILLPVGVAVTYFLQIVIYISVLQRNQQIFELISHSECVVNKRNFRHLSHAIQRNSEAFSFLLQINYFQESIFIVS